MPEMTADPDVVIRERTPGPPPTILYERVSTGEQWTVSGVCNQCGLCTIGVANPHDYAWDGPPGTPLAVRDLRYGVRLDEPVVAGFLEDMEDMARQTPTATVTGCSLVFG
jgi:hypothetical protein